MTKDRPINEVAQRRESLMKRTNRTYLIGFSVVAIAGLLQNYLLATIAAVITAIVVNRLELDAKIHELELRLDRTTEHLSDRINRI